MNKLAKTTMLLAMCATMGFAQQKVIGYYMDNSDDFYKAGFQVFQTLAAREGWKVIDIVGQGTAPEQLAAVENFITQKVNALVVVQNSPQTTSECLKLAKAAGIPEFHLTHNPPNEPGLTGFSGFDWVDHRRPGGQVGHGPQREEGHHDRGQARPGHRGRPDPGLPCSPTRRPARTSATCSPTSA